MGKVCCFVGHRKINLTKELEDNLIKTIEDLIINKGVNRFLFGSKSEFDVLCHRIINKLKEKYANIKRVAYTCKSESCTLDNQKVFFEEVYAKILKKDINLLCVDEEFEHKTKLTAGRAGYVERNYAMIDDSDYCVFYYNCEYNPPIKSYTKKDLNYYQPKSGTSIAYQYAVKRKKEIINVFY